VFFHGEGDLNSMKLDPRKMNIQDVQKMMMKLQLKKGAASSSKLLSLNNAAEQVLGEEGEVSGWVYVCLYVGEWVSIFLTFIKYDTLTGVAER
jgi:hypothetical protein